MGAYSSSFDDDRFSIERVANEVGLDFSPVSGRADEYRTFCPFCDEVLGSPDKHRHLYVNFRKDFFNCYRCLSKGGTTRFYAMLHHVSMDTAKEMLRGPREERRQPRKPKKPILKVNPLMESHVFTNGLAFIAETVEMLWLDADPDDPNASEVIAEYQRLATRELYQRCGIA